MVGHPAGVTSVKDLFYLSPGPLEPALREIAAVGYQGFEVFDGNLQPYASAPEAFLDLISGLRLELAPVYSGANFIYPDILDDELWRIRTAADWAARLGATYLVVGGGAIWASGTTNVVSSRNAVLIALLHLIPSVFPRNHRGGSCPRLLVTLYGIIPSYPVATPPWQGGRPVPSHSQDTAGASLLRWAPSQSSSLGPS